jgi:hypothetical protein
MPNEQLSFPAVDEMEVSLFGPGYGESVVIHIGNNLWILIDSCLNPNTKQPAGLEYLLHLGVDIQRSVRLVVVTHWHDDHVRGLGAVFRECASACLVLSQALKNHEFFKLLTLYEPPHTIKSSGVDEFVEIFKIIENCNKLDRRSTPYKWAIMDRLVYQEEIFLPTGNMVASAYTLSPSDASILHAQKAFSNLLPEKYQPKKRIQSRGQNHFAVALWIEVNSHIILLGSDLENTGQPDTGWSAVVDNSYIISGKRARVFKVPHHGSQSGHENRVWTECLHDNTLAALSPFNRGLKPLPTETDLQRIASLTSNAYITAPTSPRRHRFSNRVVRDTVAQVTKSIWNANHGWGQIRLRCKILESGNCWDVQLYGSAHSINN